MALKGLIRPLRALEAFKGTYKTQEGLMRSLRALFISLQRDL